MRRTQQGFTLVEIAIVLVIVGLLLGGILKGQEMITQAKVKNAITDLSGVSAAYFGYQDRYRATPGDDNGATRWGATGIPAGNNNRVLEGTYAAAAPATPPEIVETRIWWDHLRRAGFIGGSGAEQPRNAFNGMIGVQTGAAPGAALANTAGGFNNIIVCTSNLPDKVAIALDVQMDDGILGQGTVRGQLHGATDGATPAIATTASTTTYAETGTNVYTLCRPF